MLSLKQQRVLFSSLIARLVIEAPRLGNYQLAFAEVKRMRSQAVANAAVGAGIVESLHLLSLAADLDLYLDGMYQPTTEAHHRIGTLWKSYHPLCRWGGDFKPRPDGNHYSMEWEGRK